MSNADALLFLLLSFVGGIFFASFFEIPKLIFYELLALGVLYVSIFHRNKAIICFGICLVVFTLGLFRGNVVRPLDYTSQEDGGYFLSLRERFQTVIDENLSPPQSGILSAILLGNKKESSKEFKEELNRAGIRHITAISGMHIVILSGILLWLGVNLGLYRGQAFYFAVGFLWLFILMIGFQPSAVRAGIMGSMFLFCEKIGRQKSSDRALLLTAAVMLITNPSLLRYSVGFQLSFLAVLGIIYLMPLFQHLFSNVMRRNLITLKKVGDLVAMSLAAQVFVLPLLLYYFGQFSVISPITNLLVVPILPCLMALGFLLVISGVIFQPLSLIFLFPVWLLLSYITKITTFFAGLSFSVVEFTIHWLWLLIVYILLAVIIWQIKKWQRLRALP